MTHQGMGWDRIIGKWIHFNYTNKAGLVKSRLVKALDLYYTDSHPSSELGKPEWCLLTQDGGMWTFRLADISKVEIW